MRFPAFILLVVVLVPTTSSAQRPTMVRDINATPVPVSSSPAPNRGGSRRAQARTFVGLGRFRYFVATEDTTGRELYRTFGAGPVTLVKDIRPGPSSSAIAYLTVVGRKLFFRADDGTHGSELWMSDGSAAGTVMVKDIHVGANQSSSPSFLEGMGGRVYFGADDGRTGFELWTSDGTSVGTVLVADLNPGAGSSFPQGMRALGSRRTYFGGQARSTGAELWRTSGTAAGAVLHADIWPGIRGGAPLAISAGNRRELHAHYNRLFFHAEDGVKGHELWTLKAGAVAHSIGSGCGATGKTPWLVADDPILGAVQGVTSGNMPTNPGAVGILIAGMPLQQPLVAPGGCHIHVPITSFFVVIDAWMSTTKQHQSSFRIANLPVLSGLKLGMQTWVLRAPSNRLALSLSNGVLEIFGR